MLRKLLLIITLFFGLISASLGINRQSDSSQSEDFAMNNHISSGSLPENLDIRVERRDKTPLPSGVLIRFQVINRGPSPQPNYRWLLYEDGRLFLARHSEDVSGDYRIPFDTEFPSSPTKKLSPNVVTQVKENLEKTQFEEQPPYQIDHTVQDGGFYIVTARINGKVHEVIYEAASPPLVNFLKTIQSL